MQLTESLRENLASYILHPIQCKEYMRMVISLLQWEGGVCRFFPCIFYNTAPITTKIRGCKLQYISGKIRNCQGLPSLWSHRNRGCRVQGCSGFDEDFRFVTSGIHFVCFAAVPSKLAVNRRSMVHGRSLTEVTVRLGSRFPVLRPLNGSGPQTSETVEGS